VRRRPPGNHGRNTPAFPQLTGEARSPCWAGSPVSGGRGPRRALGCVRLVPGAARRADLVRPSPRRRGRQGQSAGARRRAEVLRGAHPVHEAAALQAAGAHPRVLDRTRHPGAHDGLRHQHLRVPHKALAVSALVSHTLDHPAGRIPLSEQSRCNITRGRCTVYSRDKAVQCSRLCVTDTVSALTDLTRVHDGFVFWGCLCQFNVFIGKIPSRHAGTHGSVGRLGGRLPQGDLQGRELQSRPLTGDTLSSLSCSHSSAWTGLLRGSQPMSPQ